MQSNSDIITLPGLSSVTINNGRGGKSTDWSWDFYLRAH